MMDQYLCSPRGKPISDSNLFGLSRVSLITLSSWASLKTLSSLASLSLMFSLVSLLPTFPRLLKALPSFSSLLHVSLSNLFLLKFSSLFLSRNSSSSPPIVS
ncbi:hypothetical protein AMTRI_Chr01g114260 [Amborella trichopoda]